MIFADSSFPLHTNENFYTTILPFERRWFALQEYWVGFFVTLVFFNFHLINVEHPEDINYFLREVRSLGLIFWTRWAALRIRMLCSTKDSILLFSISMLSIFSFINTKLFFVCCLFFQWEKWPLATFFAHCHMLFTRECFFYQSFCSLVIRNFTNF